MIARGFSFEVHHADRHSAARVSTFHTPHGPVDVPLRLVTADMMINFGRLAIAYNSLVAVCGSLDALRLPDAEESPACPAAIELPKSPE